MSKKKCQKCSGTGVIIEQFLGNAGTIEPCPQCRVFSSAASAAAHVGVLLRRAARKDEKDTPTHECGNCSGRFTDDKLGATFPDIPDLLERIEPGNEVPSGECPDCNALTYLIKES